MTGAAFSFGVQLHRRSNPPLSVSICLFHTHTHSEAKLIPLCGIMTGFWCTSFCKKKQQGALGSPIFFTNNGDNHSALKTCFHSSRERLMIYRTSRNSNNNKEHGSSHLSTGFSPVGSGLQLKSRDEELIYWGSVVGLHTWNKGKK